MAEAGPAGAEDVAALGDTVDGDDSDDSDDDGAEGARSTFSRWDLWDEVVERPVRELPAVAWSAVRFVWQADRSSTALSMASEVVAGLAGAVQVLVVGALLGRLISDRAVDEAVRAAVPFALVLVVVQMVSRLFNAVVQGRSDLYEERVGQAANRRILAVASAVDLLAYESPSFFDRLQRVRQQATFRPMQVVYGTNQLVSGLAGSIGIVAALVVLQPWLVPALLGVYLPVALAMQRGAWLQYQFARGMTQHERRRWYVGSLLTDRDSAKEVRAFGLRDHLLGRYDAVTEDYQRELRKVVTRQTRLTAGAEAAGAVLNGLVFLTLLWFVGSGRMTVATAGAALTGLSQLGARFGGLAYGAAILYEAVLFLNDQQELLELAGRLERERPTGAAPAGFERLAVDRVSFRYPEARRDALHDVTVELRAGQVVALVGENGSGKTTLAKLLGGLYEPTSGAIRWDGLDASTVDPDALRRLVTVVFQDFARYNFTAADNIGLGDVTRLGDRPGVEAAARQAGADRTIARLPEGYDSVLGREFDTGQDLSTGQWQRIAIARAFFRDAPVVVLDEPTAALDARAEHDLFERIRELLRGRTVLLVSHRFSTVRSADRIYVLHRGRVVESGSHDELMAAEGTYAELFRLQASAFL